MDYESALIDQNRLLSATIFAADLATPVPTCPGWSVLQLLRHVGRGDRWAAHIISTGAGADLDPRSVPDGRPPENREGARAWLEDSPRVVVDAVHTIGSDTSVATFLGPRPAAWWIRRRLHEATVHRADAAAAIAQPYELAPDLAADGIDEWLDRLAVDVVAADDAALADTEMISLNADDIGASWTIVGLPHGIRWSRGAPDSSAQVTLSGTATDLFLAIVRRRPAGPDGARLAGDAWCWERWLARTPF